MENQHKKISGYRELTQAEINMMNKAKALAADCGKLIKELRAMDSIDQQWLGEGQTDLQKGFMSVVRSIAQPTTF